MTFDPVSLELPAAVLIVGRFMRCLTGYGLAMLQPTFYEQVSSLTGVRFGPLPALHYRITPTSAFGGKTLESKAACRHPISSTAAFRARAAIKA